MANKVRVGSWYVYHPVPFDVFNSDPAFRDGDIVKVVNKFGCPPANTMGMCYIENEDADRFTMVCTNSLTPFKKGRKNVN